MTNAPPQAITLTERELRAVRFQLNQMEDVVAKRFGRWTAAEIEECDALRHAYLKLLGAAGKPGHD